MTDTSTGWTDAVALARDAAVVLLVAAVLLTVGQAIVAGEAGPLRSGLPYVGAAAVVVAGRLRPALVRVVPTVLAVGGTLLAAWVTTTFLLGLPGAVGEPSGFYRAKLAVTSPLGDHNTAAGLLLVGLVAAALRVPMDRRWWAAVGAVTVGLTVTLSRGAVLVLLLVAAVALVAPQARRLGAVLAVCGLLALGGVLGAAVVLDATPPAGSPEAAGPLGASVTGRGALVARGLELTVERPVSGVGLGGFARAAADLPPPNFHAHNLVAHAGAEGGVPLALVAAGLPIVLAVRVRRARPGLARSLAAFGGLALVAHAQLEILGGLLGYEVTLALLLVSLLDPAAGSSAARRR
ncbi:hypothetical protein FTX61_17885 [Nitriliruptoraceae bacterium ZYF776]|nr:hypothetical protein [Profundirhabdus halotolerans]